MESIVGIVSVPVITLIAYIVLGVYKKAVSGKAEIWTALIPLWGALIGAILGVVAFYGTPALVPADNVLAALLIGMVSGLASTGANQLGKQLSTAAENTKTTDGDKPETENK